MQVEVKWNVFIFLFHLNFFSLLWICSMLSSSSLLSRHKCSHQRFFIEKAALKFCSIHRKTPVSEPKLQTWRLASLLKRDSNTGVFLWMLQNFTEHQFWRTSVNRSYCREFYNNSVLILCLILYVQYVYIITLSVKVKKLKSAYFDNYK